MSDGCPAQRVLSIFPLRLGYSYAVLEGSDGLIDWGVARLGRQTDAEFRRRVAANIEDFKPTVVACEDDSNARRGRKARSRIESTVQVALFVGLRVRYESAADVRDAFGLARRATKQDIADHIIHRFPELASRTPHNRVWQRDPRMDLFEAVALAVACALREGASRNHALQARGR